MLNNMFY